MEGFSCDSHLLKVTTKSHLSKQQDFSMLEANFLHQFKIWTLHRKNTYMDIKTDKLRQLSKYMTYKKVTTGDWEKTKSIQD